MVLCADAFLVAVTRCSGIILGVLLSVILASLVFPKSASHQAADNLASALEGLCSLCQIAWNASHWIDLGQTASDQHDCYVAVEDLAVLGSQQREAVAAKEAECEKVAFCGSLLFSRFPPGPHPPIHPLCPLCGAGNALSSLLKP